MLRLDVFWVMLKPHNIIHMRVPPKLAGWCCVWGEPNFEWNMIIYSMRAELRSGAFAWISVSMMTRSLSRELKSISGERRSELLHSPQHAFQVMSHPQFWAQTALSTHKRIQNHSLQFPVQLSIRKVKPRFELFKYSLWSAGWSHELSACCVNRGVTVENGQGSKNRTATRKNRGMSKQWRESRGASCAAYHEELHWWACEGALIHLFPQCVFSLEHGSVLMLGT